MHNHVQRGNLSDCLAFLFSSPNILRYKKKDAERFRLRLYKKHPVTFAPICSLSLTYLRATIWIIEKITVNMNMSIYVRTKSEKYETC